MPVGFVIQFLLRLVPRKENKVVRSARLFIQFNSHDCCMPSSRQLDECKVSDSLRNSQQNYVVVFFQLHFIVSRLLANVASVEEINE